MPVTQWQKSVADPEFSYRGAGVPLPSGGVVWGGGYAPSAENFKSFFMRK